MSRTLTPTPTGANAPAFTTVSSSAGFSAGDLVYQKSGSVNPIPDGAVTSAAFNIPATVAINNGVTPNTSYAVAVSTADVGGTRSTPSAAKLTSGNIVAVWTSQLSNTYFRIFTEANVEVVAPTLMGSSASTNSFIAVTALTGGGFAAAWSNSSGNLVTAIYNNTGTVVAAPSTDASVTIGSSQIGIASRPDGSWVLAVNDSTSTNARFKVYSATGTQVIAWTNVVAYTSVAARTAVAVRSDNSFVIGAYTSSTNINYYLYTSAGAGGGNGSVISAANATSSNGHLDMTTLTNDSIVFVYINASNLTQVRILNSSNAFILDTNLTGAGYTCSVKSLASGGYVVAWHDSSYRYGQYQFFTATGSTASTLKINYGVGFTTGAQNGSYYSTILELTNNVAFISTTGQYSLTMTQASKSTYATVPFTTSSYTVGTGTTSVNLYARGSSTPNAAAFIASANTTLTQSYAQSSGGTYVLTPFVLESTSCSTVQTRVMPNGDIVTAVSFYNSPYALKVFVYSAIGVFKQSFTVANQAANSYSRLCVLTDGTLVVVYNPSSPTSTLVAAFYNSSYTLTSTATLATDVSSIPSNFVNYNFDVSAMTGAKFVIAYYNGSNGPTYKVYTNTGAAYGSGVNPASAAYYGVAVTGTANGGFVVRYQQNSGTMYFTWYANTTGTTFQAISTVTTNGAGTLSASYGMGMTAAPNDSTVYSAYNDGASNGYIYCLDANNVKSDVSGFNLNVNVGNTASFTTMANGSIAVIRLSSVGNQWATFAPVPGSIAAWATASMSSFPSGTSPCGETAGAGVILGASPSLCSLYDDQLVCSYISSSTYYPCLMILNATASSYSLTTVSGTTVSNAALYPSQSNGYILKGVATTAATAGGTGIVQTNGPAQLNSNYSASTTYQAFDSTGTVIPGTKGTITGRNVNMTGGA